MNNNASIVSSMYEAFSKGDIPAVIDHLADDVQWEQWSDNSAQQAGVPWLQARSGKEGAGAFFNVVGGFNFKDFRVLLIMANENKVAAEIVLEADVPATGGHILMKKCICGHLMRMAKLFECDITRIPLNT